MNDEIYKVRKQILKPLHNIGISAIIGGGFVRDIYHNRLYNDVDLYVNYADTPAVLRLLSTEKISTKSKPSYSLPHIRQTFRFTHKNYEINIVGVDFDCSNLENLRLTIYNAFCLCGITLYDSYYSDEFLKDSKDKCMTLLSVDRLEDSVKHWLRLYHRYPYPLRLANV